jgi:4-aminobutyrate aminotransferase / (S)-3-amino-2-methylpropionate transaminase / 5-aminovalerate transaminase
MTANQDLHTRRTAAVARGVAHAHPIYAERAENGEIWDVEGRRYIDFAGGIGVLNTGHRHPKVIAAVRDQLERFTHVAFQVLPYAVYVEVAERLNALAPGSWPKKTLLLSTGAEAVENAIKIARAYTGRAGVVAFAGGFHGRTLLTLALTGKVAPYKVGFGPFPAEIYHAPFPIPFHGIGTEQSLAALKALFSSDIESARIAAMIIEPVQGEGGFYVAPFEFLRELRGICEEHGILLVVDEIQSGFARTGKFFAIEHSGVEPDLIVTAKSLAGGLPLSAVVGKADAMDIVSPGGLGGTYAGNPLACAAALAVLDVIREEGLLERSRALGERIRARLEALAARLSPIGDVRGLGAMLALELVRDRETREPAPALAAAAVAEARERGLILITCGPYANVIRILVPLTAPDALVDEGLAILESALEQVLHE